MAAGYCDALFAETIRAERDHFWYRARRAIIAAALNSMDPPMRGVRVLEVGCGNGNVVPVLRTALRPSLLVGMDAYFGGLPATLLRTGAPVVQALLGATPFRVRFDIVGLFDVLEHVEDDRAALHAVHELLHVGGKVLVTVPADPELWSDFDLASGHYRRYEERDLRSALTDSGFAVEYSTPFMSLLHPLARLRRRRGVGDVDATACIRRELKVRPGVNALMNLLLSQEARAVRRRRRLPGGTSLLAVGRAR